MPNKKNPSVYSLGSTEEEQARLMLQGELYGDKKYLQFNKSDKVLIFPQKNGHQFVKL